VKNEAEIIDVPGASGDAEADASTRSRVARSILQYGPSTANELADRLHVTPAAIRRHLGVLVAIGHLSSRQQRVYGHRGRGRPSQVYELTEAGRSEFNQAYDGLALAALGYLDEIGGADAVHEFARRSASGVQARFEALRPRYDTPAEALVEALSDEGYVASLRPVGSGVQLCLYHCPISKVAREYPQLCQAEGDAFAALLGSHVQQLATIAHGDGVCTTHVPHHVDAPARPQPEVLAKGVR